MRNENRPPPPLPAFAKASLSLPVSPPLSRSPHPQVPMGLCRGWGLESPGLWGKGGADNGLTHKTRCVEWDSRPSPMSKDGCSACHRWRTCGGHTGVRRLLSARSASSVSRSSYPESHQPHCSLAHPPGAAARRVHSAFLCGVLAPHWHVPQGFPRTERGPVGHVRAAVPVKRTLGWGKTPAPHPRACELWGRHPWRL